MYYVYQYYNGRVWLDIPGCLYYIYRNHGHPVRILTNV